MPPKASVVFLSMMSLVTSPFMEKYPVFTNLPIVLNMSCVARYSRMRKLRNPSMSLVILGSPGPPFSHSGQEVKISPFANKSGLERMKFFVLFKSSSLVIFGYPNHCSHPAQFPRNHTWSLHFRAVFTHRLRNGKNSSSYGVAIAMCVAPISAMVFV